MFKVHFNNDFSMAVSDLHFFLAYRHTLKRGHAKKMRFSEIFFPHLVCTCLKRLQIKF